MPTNEIKDFQPTPPMLINQISRLFEEKMHTCDNSIMSKTSNRSIIRVLKHCGTLTQQEIVRKTGLKAPTVSVALSNLERDQIVTRKSDDDDQRLLHVTLTDKGAEILERSHEKIVKLDGILMEGMSEEEIQTALALLTRMRDNIQKSQNL